jgi:hypothetical protein
MVLSLFEDADKILGGLIMGLTALTFSLLLKKYVDDTGKLGQSILLNCMMDDCT